jgi:hypothetical protein
VHIDLDLARCSGEIVALGHLDDGKWPFSKHPSAKKMEKCNFLREPFKFVPIRSLGLVGQFRTDYGSFGTDQLKMTISPNMLQNQSMVHSISKTFQISQHFSRSAWPSWAR